MNPRVWMASGHVTAFNDPLIDCKACKSRHRADNLIEDWLAENPIEGVSAEAMTNDEMVAFIREHNIVCPVCGKNDFTDIRKFNLMFKTHQGVTEGHGQRGLPAPGDRSGHLRQLQERPAHHPPQDTLRRLPDRQELPQRDNPGQLHLPHPRVRADGAGVLLPAGDGPRVVRLLARLLPRLAGRPGHEGGESPPARPRPGGAGLLLQSDDGL